MKKRILGLDTGTNSLGWAVVDRDEYDNYTLVKHGGLIFQEGVKIEKKVESSKAAERTGYRSLRKQYFRRRLRKIEVLRVLVKHNLCPYLSEELLHAWHVHKTYPKTDDFMLWQRTSDNDDKNPYYYRHLCLHQKLDLERQDERYILGRAFYHLAQRRGFLSNRLDSSPEQETGKVKTGISDLTREMEAAGCEYLGDYFYQIYSDPNNHERIRTRYTDREQHYKKEFHAICEMQQLSQDLVTELDKALYFQRPLKSQRKGVGKCTFEPKCPRCAESHPDFEEFRMLSFINNIKIKTPRDLELRCLSLEEKEKIRSLFYRVSKPNFDFEDIAKALAGKGQYQYIKDVSDKPYKFNYRMTQGVPACPTTAQLIKIFGDDWKDAIAETYRLNNTRFGQKSVAQMVDDMLNVLSTFSSDSKLQLWAEKNLQLNEEQCKKFAGIKLFDEVDIKFTPGNCYGIIGPNGAGKSTFLKILTGEAESTSGEVIIDKNKRLSFLKQDHFAYEDEQVLNVVMMGHTKLYDIMMKKNELYSKTEFTEEDGELAAELEGEFAELDGWEAETNAEKFLIGLGIGAELHHKLMKELTEPEKVKVLLAQAIFGNPDILLLDEPTNGLDLKAVKWLEEFLMNLENTTVLVVSHDRHFLNKVCTHIADIDYGKIKMFVGNYDFWYESNQLMQDLIRNQNKKLEQKRKELQDFIARFSANASKSKQATSRKKQLEKLQFEDMQVSNRKYPYIEFKPEREAGNNMLKVENLSKTIDGEKVLDNISFTVNTGDKVVILSNNDIAKTTLFQILAGEIEPDSGTYEWGMTTSQSYFPKDNSEYFENVDLSLIDWMRQFSTDQHEEYVRGFLGRMLFSGEEARKMAKVLSGGEKVRCMLSKMMLSGANVLLLDNPTDHLDLESITSLNKSLIRFPGTVLFTTHDHEFIQTVANKIIEITPNGILEKEMEYDDYINDENVQQRLSELYGK